MLQSNVMARRAKSKKWTAKDMARFADEPKTQIAAWKHVGVLDNESNFTEAFLTLLAHELRKNPMLMLAGSTSRLAGILAAVRSILCIVDLDAGMKSKDPMEIFVANIRENAGRFTLETESQVRDWEALMLNAFHALRLLAEAIDNRGECWIYVTQDSTGRDQVCILDGPPDDDPEGHVLMSQHEPRFAPVQVAMNIREMLCDARGRMN